MRNDKHLATKLRKLGRSYNRISRELNIPKSTLCDWFSDKIWSDPIKKDLTRRANFVARKRLLAFTKEHQKKWEALRESFREEALKQFPILLNNPLFVAGINIYWGEGDSKLSNCILRISNTDPKMISVFASFLKTILKVPKEKIRVALILYPDLSELSCKNFWQKVTKIPLYQFHKTQFIYGKHPTKKSEHGICMLLVSSRYYKEKIAKWIDLFGQEYST